MAFDDTLGGTITAAIMHLDCQVTTSVLNGSSATASDGENVMTWQDQSGNGFNVTQTTASARPVLDSDGINSNPCIQGASGDFLVLAASSIISNKPALSFAAVVYHNDTASIQRLFQATNSSTDANRFMARTDPGSEVLYVEGAAPDGTAKSLFSNDALTNATVYVIVGVLDFQGGTGQLYYNGTQVHTTTFTGGSNTTNANVHFGILSNRYGSLPYTGRLGHFLLYDYALDSTEAVDLSDDLTPYWATPSAGGSGIKSSLSLLGVGS